MASEGACELCELRMKLYRRRKGGGEKKRGRGLDLHTRSNCSKMQECRSSSMSLYLRA